MRMPLPRYGDTEHQIAGAKNTEKTTGLSDQPLIYGTSLRSYLPYGYTMAGRDYRDRSWTNGPYGDATLHRNTNEDFQPHDKPGWQKPQDHEATYVPFKNVGMSKNGMDDPRANNRGPDGKPSSRPPSRLDESMPNRQNGPPVNGWGGGTLYRNSYGNGEWTPPRPFAPSDLGARRGEHEPGPYDHHTMSKSSEQIPRVRMDLPAKIMGESGKPPKDHGPPDNGKQQSKPGKIGSPKQGMRDFVQPQPVYSIYAAGPYGPMYYEPRMGNGFAQEPEQDKPRKDSPDGHATLGKDKGGRPVNGLVSHPHGGVMYSNGTLRAGAPGPHVYASNGRPDMFDMPGHHAPRLPNKMKTDLDIAINSIINLRYVTTLSTIHIVLGLLILALGLARVLLKSAWGVGIELVYGVFVLLTGISGMVGAQRKHFCTLAASLIMSTLSPMLGIPGLVAGLMFTVPTSFPAAPASAYVSATEPNGVNIVLAVACLLEFVVAIAYSILGCRMLGTLLQGNVHEREKRLREQRLDRPESDYKGSGAGSYDKESLDKLE